MKSWREARADFTREYFTELLKNTRNRSEAARVAGMTRWSMGRIMDRVGMDRPRCPQRAHRGNW